MTCGRGIQQGPRNNPASVYPVAYHQQTPLSRPKMAVFDIDDTLFDTTQRTTNAMRAGLAPSTPYTGDRKPSEYPKGRKAFMDFFDSPKQFRLDPVISGALEYVRGLAQDGYTIAYLTGRNKRRYDATLEYLRETGFPIFRRQNGETLLYMKPSQGKTDKFKFDTMRELQSEYDIHYFFDDLAKNREQAFRLGVIGVYHLPDRLGVKTNPPFDATHYRQSFDYAGRRMQNLKTWAETYLDSALKEEIGKQPSGKYSVDFTFKENTLAVSDFNKIVREYRTITTPEGHQNLPEHEDPYYMEALNLIGKDLGQLYNGAFEVRDMTIANNTFVGYQFYFFPRTARSTLGNPSTDVPRGYREAAGCIVQRASDGKVLLLRRSVLETSMHGMYELPGGKLEEGETPSQAALVETKEEAGLDVKIVQRLPSHVDDDMRKVYHGFLAVPKKNAKVVISEEHDEYKWITIEEALKLPNRKLSHHARFLFHQMQGAGLGALPNPLPKPRKKKGRREPSKNFVKRMMGNKKMRAEFPDSGQRYAVTLRLVEKHYGKAARKRIAPRPNGLFSRAKITRAIGKDSNGMNFESSKNRSYLAGTNVYEEYPPSTVISDKKVEIRYKGEHPSWIEVDTGNGPQRYQGPILEFTLDRKSGKIEAKQGSIPKSQIMSMSERQAKIDALGPRPSPVDDPRGFNRHLEESIRIKQEGRVNPPNTVPIFSGEPKGITKNLGGIFAEIQVGRNFVKDIGEAVQSIYRGLIGGRTTMAEKRMAMAVAEMQKELSDAAVKKGGNAVANLKIDYEMIPETATLTLIANADAIKMRSPPKNNPAPSKKVNKAKEAYKKFHGGKAPKEVKTETIDVGEVWYGLGPCWSIGYMSPKETGDDGQKYIHHTNEDSKDGDYPMMYATMPENGEPMIVIKGGSMKIGMRDGLAWLID